MHSFSGFLHENPSALLSDHCVPHAHRLASYLSYTALSLHIDSRNTIPVTNAAAATVDPRGLPPICTKTITVHPPLKTDCDIYKSTSTATVLTDCSDGCGLRSVKGDGEVC